MDSQMWKIILGLHIFLSIMGAISAAVPPWEGYENWQALRKGVSIGYLISGGFILISGFIGFFLGIIDDIQGREEPTALLPLPPEKVLFVVNLILMPLFFVMYFNLLTIAGLILHTLIMAHVCWYRHWDERLNRKK